MSHTVFYHSEKTVSDKDLYQNAVSGEFNLMLAKKYGPWAMYRIDNVLYIAYYASFQL